MDKSGFPYGFRSIGNNGPMLRTMILFIQSQGWKNIAVLRGRESFASTFKQLKAELAHLDADISIVVSGLIYFSSLEEECNKSIVFFRSIFCGGFLRSTKLVLKYL